MLFRSIREGVRRLAAVVNAERELVEIFGTSPSVDHMTDIETPGPDLL